MQLVSVLRNSSVHLHLLHLIIQSQRFRMFAMYSLQDRNLPMYTGLLEDKGHIRLVRKYYFRMLILVVSNYNIHSGRSIHRNIQPLAGNPVEDNHHLWNISKRSLQGSSEQFHLHNIGHFRTMAQLLPAGSCHHSIYILGMGLGNMLLLDSPNLMYRHHRNLLGKALGNAS